MLGNVSHYHPLLLNRTSGAARGLTHTKVTKVTTTDNKEEEATVAPLAAAANIIILIT